MKEGLVAIPTYNLTESALIDFFRNCTSNMYDNFDVVVFTSSNDPTDYSYLENDKVKVYEVPMPDEIINNDNHRVNVIAYKRQQLLNYAHDNGYKYCVMIDDDVKPQTAKITEESKRTTSNSYKHIKITIDENLNKMLETIKKYNASFCSCNYQMYLSFSVPNTVKINERVNCVAFYMFNVDDLFEHNITYSIDDDVTEDIDITLKILQHGLNCVTIMDYAIQDKKGASDIYKNLQQREWTHMGTFKKWHTTLYLDRHGVIRTKMKWKKYFNTFELPSLDPFQQKLLNMIENKESYDNIYKVLKEKKI